MPVISNSYLTRVDFTNLDAVKECADRLGKGMSVIKYPERNNYNITHTSREPSLPQDVEILYRTL